MSIWDRPGTPLDPVTAELLVQSWGAEHAARLLLRDGEPATAAQRAYLMMLRAAQALAWEEHRLRFRVATSYHAVFWDRFARPDVGLVAPELHRWLLEAYALCDRNGEYPAPPVTPQDAARALEHARTLLAAAHRHLGLRAPFPAASPDHIRT